MVDVIFMKLPVSAHILYLLATTEDGCLKQVLYTKVKHRQFDSKEILDAVDQAVQMLRGVDLERHLLAIVADEGTNNVLLEHTGYPVMVDLRHLIVRMDAGMGHADVLLQAVHSHVIFRSQNVPEKFASIRSKTDNFPVSARRRVLAEILVLERVVVRRFAVMDTPFHLKEANNNVLESSGRTMVALASSIMAEALLLDPKMKARQLECHKLLRRVVCLLSMLEKLDLDLSGLAD